MSKRARTWKATDVATPGERLRHHMVDIHGTNALPCERLQEMMNEYAAAGIPEFQWERRPLGTNVARGIKKSFLRYNQWPKPYWAEIRVKEKRTGLEVDQR